MQPTNTYATTDMVGIREDLAEAVYMISPSETPFLNMARGGTADNTTVEWQTDSLTAAASNAQIEGDDVTADSLSATTRLNNLTQISWKVPRVTGTARAVNTAGRDDELDYQMLKSARELRRDMETVLLANQAKVTGNDTTARQLGAIGSWITTNDDFAGDGGSPTAADGTDARTDGTQRAVTESMLKTVLRNCFDEGGNPGIIMVGPFNRQQVSTFTGGSTSFQKAEDKTLHATFNVYESDFGQLKVVPNRFQRERDMLVLDMEYWQVPFMPGREFAQEDIAKTGDSDSRMVLSEYSLKSLNEAASGMVADLTTS